MRVLWLNHNLLTELPSGILLPFNSSLQVLVLSHNLIDFLDPYIFLPMVWYASNLKAELDGSNRNFTCTISLILHLGVADQVEGALHSQPYPLMPSR